MTALASGLAPCGRLRDADGAPLRPGGDALTERLIARAGFRAGDRVLDVGCGCGASAAGMLAQGIAAIGIDCDAAALAEATRCGVAVVRARGEALPFGDGAVDGVIAECSLSLMQRTSALTEWARVLRPGGVLALADLYARAGGDTAGPFVAVDRLRQDLAAAGLVAATFEDRSDVLGAFVARFIFAHGGVEALWGDCAHTEAARRARVGYGVITATKPGGARQ